MKLQLRIKPDKKEKQVQRLWETLGVDLEKNKFNDYVQ